jgi:hypothetical protein
LSTPREVLEPQVGDLVEHDGVRRLPPGIVVAITHEYEKWNEVRAVVQWMDGDRDPFGYEFGDLKILSKAPHSCAT